ncbi:MAG: hypothetical protein IKQ76_05810 [Bacteroidales bacterium]|nr:hypothetical protein [Bacteroidales bacterium]
MLVVLIASLFHLDKFWNFVGAVAVMYVIVSLGSLIPSRRERRKKGLWEEDDFDLCERLYKALSAKTDGGTDLTALNEHEKIFLTMAQLDENCGFSEYFTKFRGVYNDLLVPSAEAVGSPEIAGICRRVLELHAGYSGPDEGLDDLFEQCLDDFIDSDDDLVELCAQYARDHKESFRE